MQYVLLLLAFVSVSASSLRGLVEEPSNVWSEFTKFQKKFDKFYQNVEELEYRLSVFRENLHFVVSHNMLPGQNFTLGINQFADLTEAEFREQYFGATKPLETFKCNSFSYTGKNIPASVDWRKSGLVVPVKDQGQCGSCWAFSASFTASVAASLSSGKVIDLSEQQLVDCAGLKYGNLGCNGGMYENADHYYFDSGACSENSYPYVSGTTKSAGTCQKCTPVAQFSKCYDITPNNELALKEAVAQQPVSIAIEADTKYFQLYSGGVMTDAAKCGTTLDHAINIVGYNEVNGQKYWIARNSWGQTWGTENGYVFLARSDSQNTQGMCGLAQQPSFISV